MGQNRQEQLFESLASSADRQDDPYSPSDPLPVAIYSRLDNLGHQQITSLSAATSLTVPTGATIALVQAETQNVRWRGDGTAPTASVGTILAAGTAFPFTEDLAGLQFIEVTTSAKLNIAYYSERGGA